MRSLHDCAEEEEEEEDEEEEEEEEEIVDMIPVSCHGLLCIKKRKNPSGETTQNIESTN